MTEILKCPEMLDATPFEVYAIDIVTNKIVYANEAFKNNKKEIDTKPCYAVIHSLESRCPFCKKNELLDNNGRPNGKTVVFEFFNEFDEKWYQMQGKAAVWDDGSVVLYCFAVDINALKQTQNSLAEAHAELAIKNKELEINQIQLAKQAQLGELLDLIAHQWKQPLSAISVLFGELKILESMNMLDNESVVKIYTEGRSAVDSMTSTLDSFRNFFNPSNEKKSFDALKAIYKAHELINKKFILDNIETEFPDDVQPILVYGAPNEFAQVILALFVNAGEAIAAKRVKNNLGCMEYQGRLKIAVEKDVDSAAISICDNGIGIKEELLHKIFENRFTTKGGSGGSGVGLAMAKLIIEDKMQGGISAENHENGACFKIKLPLKIIS